MVTQSLAKQNYTQLVEDALNQQIQVYQTAQQTYLAASAYFDQAQIALPGFVKYFHERAEHEGEMAQHLIDYQITRGGICIIQSIPQPLNDWQSATNAIETCISLEKDVNKSLFNLTLLAYDNGDSHLRHVIKTRPMKHKVETIENVVKGYTQIKRVGGEGLGLYLIDQDIYENKKFAA